MSRTLSGTLPCGVRTFLPRRTSACAKAAGSDRPVLLPVLSLPHFRFYRISTPALCSVILSSPTRPASYAGDEQAAQISAPEGRQENSPGQAKRSPGKEAKSILSPGGALRNTAFSCTFILSVAKSKDLRLLFVSVLYQGTASAVPQMPHNIHGL
jgi:hypothetical protein